MSYKITQYTYDKARQYDLTIKPSTKQYKKIDLFNSKGRFLASIGDTRYDDFPTYILKNGLEYALKRRELYYKRHNKQYERYSNDWLSKKLLW